MNIRYYSTIIAAFILLVLFSCNSGREKEKENKATAVNAAFNFSDTAFTKLLNKQICMVNNRFMNADQIAVPFNNKTYYGCCEGCVKTLNEDTTSRFTSDPLSGEEVDKAIAFIVGKPGTKEDVLYFKSETNAREYFNKNYKQKIQ